MNILFVCSRNKWRSLTAEDLFKNHPEHHVRSAGTSETARVRVNQKTLDWADLIFVMEKRHKDLLKNRFNQFTFSDKIVVLDIPDAYSYMDPELIEVLCAGILPFGIIP